MGLNVHHPGQQGVVQAAAVHVTASDVQRPNSISLGDVVGGLPALPTVGIEARAATKRISEYLLCFCKIV